jgi:hypothetical protein
MVHVHLTLTQQKKSGRPYFLFGLALVAVVLIGQKLFVLSQGYGSE